jgi:hypothetical protein
LRKSTDHLSKILEMIVHNKLDEAEKQVESIKPSDEYEAGYLRGLRGILQAIRKPIEGSLIKSSNPKAHLESIRESVKTHYLSREEEGYFTAWISFLEKLSGSKKGVVKKKPSE